MPILRSMSQEHTRAIGAALGARLRPGDVVLLKGPMGAGKSELARGIAHGMGIDEAMPSPSFPVLLVYEGPTFPLYHMDLFRLEDAEACYAMGLPEYLGGDGAAVVEWPERALEIFPKRYVEFQMDYGEEPDTRVLRVLPHGGFPQAVLQDLEDIHEHFGR